MKIASLDILSYNLPLARPLFVKSRKLSTRKGLILHVKDQEGNNGYGETAPLPGFHRETLEEAERELHAIRPYMTGMDLPASVKGIGESLDMLFKEKPLLPTVRFGIEMALLDLAEKSHGLFLHELFHSRFNRFVKVNGLLTGDRGEIIRQVELLLKDKYSSFKLKVGRKDISYDIELVNRIRETIPEHASLRIDANRSWTLDKAVAFGDAISGTKIDYIEEPTEDFRLAQEFYRHTGIPFALDETIAQTPFEEIAGLEGLKAIILKPCLAGGIYKTLEILKEAKKSNIIPVFSSPFYSGVGLCFLANIASILAPRDVPAGLDTFRWFKKDLKTFAVENGMVAIENLAQKTISYDILIPCSP